MRAAYVDTSCLVAIALGEPGSAKLVRTLDSYDQLLSSNLLEAELRSALHREQVDADPASFLGALSWVFTDRPLTREFATVLSAGYVRGADLWHLAVALFVAPALDLDFLTLDTKQAETSAALGFGGLL